MDQLNARVLAPRRISVVFGDVKGERVERENEEAGLRDGTEVIRTDVVMQTSLL